MRAARVKPLSEGSTPAPLGPQLVPPREKVPQRSEREDQHTFVTILIVALIAFTLAFTIFSTVMMWVWFRNTGVDWMFQRS